MGDYNIPRRYYHRMRMNARALGDRELEGVWRYKQEAQPGTALPAEFPYLPQLTAAGYTTIEDLNGADEYELRRVGDFDCRETQVILTQYAVLTVVVA